MTSAPHADPQKEDYVTFENDPVPKKLHRVELRGFGFPTVSDCGVTDVIQHRYAWPPRFPAALCSGCYPQGF